MISSNTVQFDPVNSEKLIPAAFLFIFYCFFFLFCLRNESLEKFPLRKVEVNVGQEADWTAARGAPTLNADWLGL